MPKVAPSGSYIKQRFHEYEERGVDERTYSTLNLIAQSVEEAFSGKPEQKQSQSEIDRYNGPQSKIANILTRSLDWKT